MSFPYALHIFEAFYPHQQSKNGCWFVFATGATMQSMHVPAAAGSNSLHVADNLWLRDPKRRCLREFPLEPVSSAIGSGAWRLRPSGSRTRWCGVVLRREPAQVPWRLRPAHFLRAKVGRCDFSRKIQRTPRNTEDGRFG